MLIRQALPKRSHWRRHLPFALFLFALTCLIIALARPAAQIEVPLSRTTIILALDVSRSMCATDVSPNRLSVAQEAVIAFIKNQVAGTQIGIVAFGGFAETIVSPTRDKEILQEAVTNLTTSRGTAIGSATLKSIDAIAEINTTVAPSGLNLGDEASDFETELATYQPDIIVLLTDGANTRGPDPLSAAQQAADRKVRVYTIGFGTTEFTEMVCTQKQLGVEALSEDFGRRFNGTFGGGFGGGGNFQRFLFIDEPTLQAVADITGGEYYRAENIDQLYEVFLNLPSQIILQMENLEISVFFSALAAISTLLAILLSLLWNRFP